MSATVRGGASRPREKMNGQQLRRWIRAENKVDAAKEELRRVTVEILAEGASFAEVSKATGLSTNTLQRWKREVGAD